LSPLHERALAGGPRATAVAGLGWSRLGESHSQRVSQIQQP